MGEGPEAIQSGLPLAHLCHQMQTKEKENLKCILLIKEARVKKLHIVGFEVYNILIKAKLRRQ